MFESWLQDARYSLRLLRKSPMFTATATLSLAIGIGANATIFSIASALLLRPLPGLAEPDRLVDIGRTDTSTRFDTTSYPNYKDIRSRMTTVQDLYAYEIEPTPMSLSENGNAERIYGGVVSANYFTALGMRPELGRLLRDEDDAVVGGSPVAVISHALWQRRFAGDPAIVGRSITLNGSAFTVVGVTPPGFQGSTVMRHELWVPISMLTQAIPRMRQTMFTSRGASWLFMGGRLKPGVTVAQANAEAHAIGAALAEEFPRENQGKSLTVAAAAAVPGQVSIIAGFLGLLMTIVGLVLLIACVNVAGMLLARAAGRRREIAVRLAIGAGRRRLIRQLMTETAVLFAGGCAIGLLLNVWLTKLVLLPIPQLPVPIALDITMDWRVVSFALAVSFVAALLSGLAPALQASGADLVPALKADGLDGGRSRLRLRNVFVVGQVAMSLVLIVAAGLFLRALHRASTVDPGFDQASVDVVSLDLSLGGYSGANGNTLVRDLIARTSQLPGVQAASATVDLPLDGGRMGLGGYRVAGVTPPNGRKWFGADWNVVAPGFFATLRLPLARGREFTESDTPDSLPVAIVNEALARQFWPDGDALGRQLEVEGDSEPRHLTIVGVSTDARLVSLSGDAEPYIYVPLAQYPMSKVHLVVRTSGASSLPAVRGLVREMAPTLPVIQAMPLSEITAIGLVPQRIAATVAGSLGIVGLLLAAIGIYGVTSYAVSRRTREIGIRIALGANTSTVLSLILRQGLVLAAIGVAIGVAMAAAGSQVLGSLLFGIPGLDPVTFGAACVLFAAVTLVATYIPARRATNVDPMIALRDQ